MKQFKELSKIISLDLLHCSVMGNPRYRVTFMTGKGMDVRVHTGTTQTDGQIGYQLPLPASISEIYLTWHVTAAGNIIIEKLDYVVNPA